MSLEKFRKVFSLLPEAERKLIVVVIDNKLMTWEATYKEIKENTELGKKMQKKLEDLNII